MDKSERINWEADMVITSLLAAILWCRQGDVHLYLEQDVCTPSSSFSSNNLISLVFDIFLVVVLWLNEEMYIIMFPSQVFSEYSSHKFFNPSKLDNRCGSAKFFGSPYSGKF